MPAVSSLFIIIPARDEAETIREILKQLQEIVPDAEVVVVDDGSHDATAQIAGECGARVICHPYSKGNGASVKSGLRAVTGTNVVIMDADGQHNPNDIPGLVAKLDRYDLVVGARDTNSETSFGRRLYHGALNAFGTFISDRPVLDATSGFRAAKLELFAQFIHLYPNGFSTPVTSTLAFIKAGYSVDFYPLTMYKRAGGQSKIRPVADGLRFFIIVFRMITLFAPMKVFLPTSLVFITLALIYTALDVLFVSQRLHVANTAVLLFTMGVLVFLIGLVSEQIAALRFERSGKE